jgi:hypothetical protein
VVWLGGLGLHVDGAMVHGLQWAEVARRGSQRPASEFLQSCVVRQHGVVKRLHSKHCTVRHFAMLPAWMAASHCA